MRQTLLLGAGLGIFLPALVLAYFQISSTFDSELNLRVRAPLQQSVDVLARGLAPKTKVGKVRVRETSCVM